MTRLPGGTADPVAQLGSGNLRLHVRASHDERRAAAVTALCNATNGAGTWAATPDGADPGPYVPDARRLLDILGLDERT